MRYRNVLAIINPRAGRKGTEKNAPRLLRELCAKHGAAVDVRTVVGSSDTRIWTEHAAAEGFDCVAVAGGDGTINEAASGLRAGGMLPLAMLPTGSTNLVAQELKIPHGLKEAVELLATGNELMMDLADVTSHHQIMLTSVAIGYGSRIVEDAKTELKNVLGYPAYLLAALKNILRVPTATFHCTVDGVLHTLTGQMALVSNMNLASLKVINLGPDVRYDDGKLNLVVINHSSVIKMVELIANMVLYPNKPKPHMTVFEGSRIELTAEPTLPVTIDGEVVGGGTVVITCIPKGMRVIVPVQQSTA